MTFSFEIIYINRLVGSHLHVEPKEQHKQANKRLIGTDREHRLVVGGDTGCKGGGIEKYRSVVAKRSWRWEVQCKECAQ